MTDVAKVLVDFGGGILITCVEICGVISGVGNGSGSENVD